MRRFPLLALLPAAVLVACRSETETTAKATPPARQRPAGVSPLFASLPDTAPAPADNPTTKERVDLGHKLFFEPKLSRSGIINCNTCHVVGAGGIDSRHVAMGEGAREGNRNSPTVFNAAFLKAQFWDGRAPTLEEQAKGPIQAHVEMDLTPAEAIARLDSAGYRPFFAAAFPGQQDPLTFNNVARAIAAFERTLLTPGAPFDRYLAGDTVALTSAQKQGLALFQAAGCVGCHNGAMLGGNGFAPFSHARGKKDMGRSAVTKEAIDEYVFRIAPLRNVARTAPYFHDGSVTTLEEAVSVMGNSQLKRKFSDAEVASIVAFLEALTGEFPLITHPTLPRASRAPR